MPALFPPLFLLLSLDAVSLADDFIWTARNDFDLLCLWQLRNICGGGHRDLFALHLAGKFWIADEARKMGTCVPFDPLGASSNGHRHALLTSKESPRRAPVSP